MVMPERSPESYPQPRSIELFRDENYFLSSMYPLAMGVKTPDGKAVSSVEIGYQAEKFTDLSARKRILNSVDGYAAKRLARKLEAEGNEIRPDWNAENKIEVMRWYVRQKFGRNEDVANMLLATGNAEIIEKNGWGDTFWGVSKVRGGIEEGNNNLGIILMETRGLLSEGVDLLEIAAQDASQVAFFQNLLKDK